MTPQPGHPATGSQDSTSSTRPVRPFTTEARWRLGKSRRRSQRSQRPSASEQAHVELGIVEVLEISGGRSPLIIEDLDVYPQLPRPTGAPTLNSEEPVMGQNVVCDFAAAPGGGWSLGSRAPYAQVAVLPIAP